MSCCDISKLSAVVYQLCLLSWFPTVLVAEHSDVGAPKRQPETTLFGWRNGDSTAKQTPFTWPLLVYVGLQFILYSDCWRALSGLMHTVTSPACVRLTACFATCQMWHDSYRCNRSASLFAFRPASLFTFLKCKEKLWQEDRADKSRPSSLIPLSQLSRATRVHPKSHPGVLLLHFMTAVAR